MAIKEEIIVEVSEDGLDSTLSKVNALGKASKNTSEAAKDMSKSISGSANSVLENGGAIGLLDEATGGYATKVKDAVEASTLFTKSQKSAAIMQAFYTTVVGTSTGAMKIFRLALISTGIGAIVVGLGLLIANFDKVKKFALAVVPGLSLIGDIFEKLVQTITDFIGITSDATRALDKMVEDAEASLKKNEHFLEANGDKFDQYTQRKLRANIDYNKKVKELAADEELTENEKLSRLKDFRDKANREILKADSDRQAELDKKRKEEADKVAEHNKKLAEEAKKRIEEQRKLEEAEAARQKKIREDANALQGKTFESELDAEVQAQIKKDEVLNALKEESDIAKLEKQRDLDLEVLNQANASQQEILDLNLSYDAKIKESQDASRKAKEDSDKEAAEKEKQLAQSVANAKIQIAGQTLALIGSLAKEGSAVAKGVAVAQATIDTYKGAISAYSAMAAIPIVGPALGAVSAGLVVASGLVNIKKILATKPVETGAPSATSSAPSPPTAPSFNLVQGTGANQIANAVTGRNDKPIKAYVVSQDQTNAAALDRNIVQQSTL